MAPLGVLKLSTPRYNILPKEFFYLLLMDSIENILKTFIENEQIFKDQHTKIKDLEESLAFVNEEVEDIKHKFKKDIEEALNTIKILQEERDKLKQRVDFAEMHLNNLINLINLGKNNIY